MQNTEVDLTDAGVSRTGCAAGLPAIEVAVGVLLRGSARNREVFVARRAKNKAQGGLLEFPGGKIEDGESPERALGRELREELGIVFGEHTEVNPLIEIRWQYVEGEAPILLRVFGVKYWHGEPRGNEGQPARWIKISDLLPASFPPANRGIIEALSCPRILQITPDRRPEANTLAGDLKVWQLSDCYSRSLPQLALLLRNRTISAEAYARYLAEVVTAFESSQPGQQSSGALTPLLSIGVYLDHGKGGGLKRQDLRRWLESHTTGGSAKTAPLRGAAFVHLTAGQCQFWQQELSSAAEQTVVYTQFNDRTAANKATPLRTALELPEFCSLSASVHCEEELWRSIGLGVDRITLSPVTRTETHPRAETLGWAGFSALAAACPVPCLALGGMTEGDLDTSLRYGGHGVAGIRGLGYPT